MRAALASPLALGLAACTTTAADSSRISETRPGMAVLAADKSQNRLAQNFSVITALRQTAARGAITFTPEPVDALGWLSEQGDFPATQWSARTVIVSCDGTLGVTTGAIRWGEYPGYYTTIWRYEPPLEENGRGQWRWVLSHGDGVEIAEAVPDRPQVLAASCETPPELPGPTAASGRSPDGSLRYRWNYGEETGMTLTVEMWDGAAFRKILENVVPATQRK